MVKLGLADQNVSDSAASGQNAGSFMEKFPTGDGEAGADGGNKSLISSSPGGSLISSFLPMMYD